MNWTFLSKSRMIDIIIEATNQCRKYNMDLLRSVYNAHGVHCYGYDGTTRNVLERQNKETLESMINMFME